MGTGRGEPIGGGRQWKRDGGCDDDGGAALAGRRFLAFAGIGIGEGEQRTLDRVGSGSPTRSIVAGLSIALLALGASQAAALATW